jgi:photosystem II stability/assembly factor-like uncharacterized protein
MAFPGARAMAIALMVWMPAVVMAAEVKDNLYGVRTVSKSEAWAVGNFGSVYHTTDAGKSWKLVDSGTRLPLFSIDFADAKRGWAVGKSGVILTTTDGGERWKPQQSPIPPDKHLFEVQALDANTAWAVGDWGAITMTTDGGATWHDRSLGKLGVRSEDDGSGRVTTTLVDDVILYGLSFPDPQHGFICGEFGTVLATSDGGKTWVQRKTPTEKTLFGIHFATPTEGWTVGIDGLVMRTADAGKTWDVQHGEPEAAAVDEISFVDSMKNPGMYAVSVVGDYGVVVGDVGMVLVSTDRGRTWSRRELPDDDRLVWLRGISLLPDSDGFLVGASGFSAQVAKAQVTVPNSGKTASPIP